MHYMMILVDNKESSSDLSIWIKLLNQHTQKLLSVIITKKEFLNSIQKFKLLWLEAIFKLTNLFNLQDENIVLSNNKIRLKKRLY